MSGNLPFFARLVAVFILVDVAASYAGDTQQEVVHAITAGIPTKVAGIADTGEEVMS